MYEELIIEPHSGLLVIDYQEGFITENTKHIVDPLNCFLMNRNQEFDLVIGTKFINPADSNFRSLIHWDKLTNEPETCLLDSVNDVASVIVEKGTYSAAVEVSKILLEKELNRVYVVGVDTDVCVLHTAAGLFDLGFTPIVLASLCATNGGDEAQTAAIPLLGRTVGTAQVLLS